MQSSFVNLLDILRFWLIVQIFALAALPLAWRWLSPLPSRGYVLAKPLGLLLVSYLLWMGASLGLLRNSAGGILLSLAMVAALSLWLGRAGWQQDHAGQRLLFHWLREHWVLIVVSEVLFLVALVGWTSIRSFSPEITTAGGEKFMELTFLNGILRSQQFPPQDPWLSGFGISYYYFGYVMLAALTRLSGLAPSVAFNVGLGTWFALTVTAAFGVAYDLAGALVQRTDRGRSLAPYVAGGLGALFVGVLSNLQGFLESLFTAGIGPLSFWRWLDVKDLNCLAGPSFTQPLENCLQGGGLAPERFFWWWRASRVINDRDLLGNAVEVIDEFPFFSFLLGDMHPHVLALPFVLLAIGLALAILLGVTRDRSAEITAEDAPTGWSLNALAAQFPLGWGGFVLAALCLGGLAFLNTWDFPIYLFLTGAALAVRLAWQRGGLSWAVAGQALLASVALGIAGGLLYLPFYLGFQSQAGGILPNYLFGTRLSQFFVMFGPLLAAAVFLLLALSTRPLRGERFWRRFGVFFLVAVLLPLAFLLLLLIVGVATGAGQEYMRRLMELPAVQQQVGSMSVGQLAAAVAGRRITAPWTYLALAGLVAWVLALLAGRLSASDEGEAAQEQRAETPAMSAATVFALLLLVTAFLLTFGVEFVYLRDTFGTRMNTVFKFYFQAWILLALAGSFGVVYLARYAGRALRWVALPILALLVVAGLFYPVFGISTRAEGFKSQPTLDGTAYLAQQRPADAAVIRWLNENVPGTAVVLEAPGGSYSYAGRISAQTGLPTLLGWDGHELQWRGDVEEQNRRRPDIERIYQGAPAGELAELLARWQIDYVVVGQQEQEAFGVSPQVESRLAQVMELVYDADGTRIYRRRG